MQLPVVNVLTYAHREDASEHDRYAAWLHALTASYEPFAVADIVLAGFLRIVTNPRVFHLPTPMETALAFCQRLVDWLRASFITPSRGHWDIFVGLCGDIKGPLVSERLHRRPRHGAWLRARHDRWRFLTLPGAALATPARGGRIPITAVPRPDHII
jgi:uncharacterized protein